MAQWQLIITCGVLRVSATRWSSDVGAWLAHLSNVQLGPVRSTQQPYRYTCILEHTQVPQARGAHSWPWLLETRPALSLGEVFLPPALLVVDWSLTGRDEPGAEDKTPPNCS